MPSACYGEFVPHYVFMFLIHCDGMISYAGSCLGLIFLGRNEVIISTKPLTSGLAKDQVDPVWWCNEFQTCPRSLLLWKEKKEKGDPGVTPHSHLSLWTLNWTKLLFLYIFLQLNQRASFSSRYWSKVCDPFLNQNYASFWLFGRIREIGKLIGWWFYDQMCGLLKEMITWSIFREGVDR